MRRMALLTIAATALGLAIGGVSLASQGPANNANPLVLELLSRATAINNFVDTGPTGPSPGDLYVFSDRLFQASAPDDQIGRVDGRCVLIDPATFRFDCSFTNHISGGGGLPAGDVTAAGTLNLVEGTTSTTAVVGGTGPYRTVRGDAVVKLGPFEGPHEVTANLILNP
jgi:Dirigent-like protein